MITLARVPRASTDPQPLVFRPEDCISERTLARCVARQCMRLVPHTALYVYLADEAAPAPGLRTARVELPASQPVAVPAFDTHVPGQSLPQVPLIIQSVSRPRRWTAGGQAWLDLPVGPWLLVRFQLDSRRSMGRLDGLDRLARWAARSQPAAAAARIWLAQGGRSA